VSHLLWLSKGKCNSAVGRTAMLQCIVSQTGYRGIPGFHIRGVKWFGKTNMPNCRRGLLAVLNFYVRITIRVATFVTNYVTDNTLTVNRCLSPEASSSCSQVKNSSSPQTVDVTGEIIRFTLVVDLLRVMYKFWYFDFVFYLVWTGRGLSVSSVAFRVPCHTIY
jgi:hypothetical protein